jgi:hypothetical protein
MSDDDLECRRIDPAQRMHLGHVGEPGTICNPAANARPAEFRHGEDWHEVRRTDLCPTCWPVLNAARMNVLTRRLNVAILDSRKYG